MMTPLDDKTDSELMRSVLAEVAKAKHELKCAREDQDKATGRLAFALLLINTLLERRSD